MKILKFSSFYWKLGDLPLQHFVRQVFCLIRRVTRTRAKGLPSGQVLTNRNQLEIKVYNTKNMTILSQSKKTKSCKARDLNLVFLFCFTVSEIYSSPFPLSCPRFLPSYPPFSFTFFLSSFLSFTPQLFSLVLFLLFFFVYLPSLSLWLLRSQRCSSTLISNHRPMPPSAALATFILFSQMSSNFF